MNVRVVWLAVAAILAGACRGTAAPGTGAPAAAAAAVIADSDTEDAAQDANAQIAAAVPWTDIWLLPLAEVLAGNPKAPARNVTKRRGYDNQPAFSADGTQLYFSSIRDGRQADVYRYELASGQTRRLTETPESEYSPTPRDGGFSTVRVALDGTQRLWWYGADGRPREPLRADLTGVGYHAWLGERRLALFLVEEPLRLVLAELDGEGALTVATDIGRSLHGLGGGRLAYVRKHSEEDWAVHVYDADQRVDRRRAATLPGAEDMVWLADGSALMASGRGLHRLRPAASRFEPLVELAWTLHGDIGRLAVDPTGRWLAVVVAQLEK